MGLFCVRSVQACKRAGVVVGPNDREHRRGRDQRHAIPDGAGTESNVGTHSTTVRPVLTAPPAEGPVRVPTRAKAMATFLAIVDATTLAYCHMVRHG